MKKIVCFFISCLFIVTGYKALSQEFDYSTASINLPVTPTIKTDGTFKTYDVKVLVSNRTSILGTNAKAEEVKNSFRKNYLIPFAGLRQVDSTGDFHIVALLQLYAAKGYTSAVAPATGLDFKTNMAIYTAVYDRYGRQLFLKQYINPETLTHFNEKWSSSDVKANEELIRNTIIQQVINASTKAFESKLTGGQSNFSLRIAYLNDVKKFPELKVMNDQADALKKACRTSIQSFTEMAEKLVPSWEKMTVFADTKDSNEVKRAGYLNLTNYYILTGNNEKAISYIEQFKPIDKTVKEMMGLIKFKNSEECEKMMTALTPEITELNTSNSLPVIDREVNADLFSYYVVNGTATIDDRKQSGTYTGILKIKYPEPAISESGNILDLDASDVEVLITYKNESGEEKQLGTYVSKITSMKDAEGKSYIAQKFGSALLGGSQYSLMKEVFVSPKITTMKVIVPQGGEFLVKKNGDDKGVKTGLFNTKKPLIDYLQDCPAAVQLIKDATSSSAIPLEKIGVAYTNCN